MSPPCTCQPGNVNILTIISRNTQEIPSSRQYLGSSFLIGYYQIPEDELSTIIISLLQPRPSPCHTNLRRLHRDRLILPRVFLCYVRSQTRRRLLFASRDGVIGARQMDRWRPSLPLSGSRPRSGRLHGGPTPRPAPTPTPSPPPRGSPHRRPGSSDPPFHSRVTRTQQRLSHKVAEQPLTDTSAPTAGITRL